MLNVAVVLTDSENPSAGECRLLEALRQDHRFAVALLKAGKQLPAKIPIAIATILRIERAGLNIAGKTPEFRCNIKTVQSLDDFATLDPAPDVIVDFSGLKAVEAYADAVPFGMWRLDAFSHGAGLDAAFKGKGTTLVSLLRYQGKGHPLEAIARAQYDTKSLASMSVMYIQEKSVQLIERELARLTIGTIGAYDERAPEPPIIPGNGDLAWYLCRTIADITGRVWRAVKARMGLRPRMFTLRVGQGVAPDFDLASSVEIPPPGNRYWADPFLFENNGETFLFFEDYDYQTRRGHISVGKVNGTDFELIGPAHTASHHLSYPYVFRHGDDVFMLPETHQAGRIEIWRAHDFPIGWTLYSTALDGLGAVDTVLKEIDGVWWIFTNICRDSFNDHCSELHIFRTDGPAMTTIEPHKLNPVVIGSDTARGGGRVFCQDGRWFRVSQDNSGGVYGYGMNIMEIQQLDLENYRERRVRHVTPDFMPGLIGCHHFDAAGGLFVIDTRKP